MRHILFTTIIFAISVCGYAQKSSIKGTIKGIDNATINVLILPLKEGETPIFDTTSCNNGKFEYTLNYNVDMWHLVILSSDEFYSAAGIIKTSDEKLKNLEIRFFIKPSDAVTISASVADLGIMYNATGNNINSQMSEAKKETFPFETEFNRLALLHRKAPNESEEFSRLVNKIHLTHNQIDSVQLSIIAKHPDWEYSAELLPGYTLDTIAKYYDSFTPPVKNSFFGKNISKTLNASEKGSPAPLFTLADNNGKQVSLSDFKGQYVVLDFWGTWCGYCVKEIPKFKEYCLKYSKKAEFISINCRDDKSSWIRAIEKYEMDWKNLFATNDETADKYGVTGYPTKLLIDKEGKIVLKTIGEEDEFYSKLDEIFK